MKSVQGFTSLEEELAALPHVPGIIEAAMTITQEPDGKLSFLVLVSADGERAGCCDRIELIFSPEHVRQALARTEIRRLADARAAEEMPTFPCHIGFSRDSANPAP